ncbi:MAG: flagellar hook protein, partial [Halomonas sp.]
MGSISSLGIGSGLDLNGLLDQLQEAERGKLEPIEQQLETQQTKISAYGQLQSALSQFQSASNALNDTALYESLSTNVGGTAVTAAANAEAQPGSYNVTVDQLATAGTLATNSVADPEASLTDTDRVLTLQFAGDDEVDVPVQIAAGSSLEDIRDAINATENSGVSASIIFDGEEYRLALNSTQTGEAASISGIGWDGGDDPLAADVMQAGQNALLNVNGIEITSPSIQVE